MWYRELHTVYVQNPEQTAEEHRDIIEESVEFQVANLNEAMRFHELDFRFVEGEIYVKSSEFWTAHADSCGDVRRQFCTPWTDELGRQSDNTLEMWMCVMPDKVGCAGVGGGNTIMVRNGPLQNQKKIVVLHEIGHCLGCGDKQKLCQPDFEEFSAVTGKRYMTVMGGGSKCDPTGLETPRLPYYEDATKQYCEEGVCLTLADENHECMTTIKKKFSSKVNSLKPYCDGDIYNGINGPNFAYCISESDAVCNPSFKIDVGDFAVDSSGDCAEILKEDPTLCPSGTFYFQKNKKKCRCCEIGFESEAGKFDLLNMKIQPAPTAGVRALIQTYSTKLQDSGNNIRVLQLFAIIGALVVVKFVIDTCKKSQKTYATIPEPQFAEI